MNRKKSILIICDSNQYCREHMLQIMSKAKNLARESQKVLNILCMGQYDETQFQTLANYGADMIMFSKQTQQMSLKRRTDIASVVLQKVAPEVILLPATDMGKAMAAILSTRFEIGLIADCIDMEFIEDKDFYFSRAALNASIIAKIKCINCEMKMGTIKKDVFIAEKVSDQCSINVEHIECDEECEDNEERIEVLEVSQLQKVAKEIDLSQYSIIFGIGRGAKENNVKERIMRLAERWGAIVVGTRPLVEEGLIEEELQVGQSGKNISPRVYICFGISGASQHIVGIKNAKTIIAINNDSNAPIFDYADYCIVEDINVVIEELEKLA